MQKVILIFLILVALIGTINGQTECSDQSIKKLGKEIRKEKHLGKKWPLTYKLAQCYKTTNDSVYRSLLEETLNTIKSLYDNPPSELKVQRLFIAAEISFILKRYNEAEAYFQKGFAGLKPSVEIQAGYLYEFGDTLCNLGHYDDAIKFLETYNYIFPGDPHVRELLEKCRSHVNNR